MRGDADRHIGLARLPPPPEHSRRGVRPHILLLGLAGYHQATGSQLASDGKTVSRAVASAVCCWDLDTATLMARLSASLAANLKMATRLKLAHGGSSNGWAGPVGESEEAVAGRERGSLGHRIAAWSGE